jgi:peptidyl-prolyl cis-trans isomerase SurA
MRLIHTLSLGAAALALLSVSASGQQRTAANQAAVPAVAPAAAASLAPVAAPVAPATLPAARADDPPTTAAPVTTAAAAPASVPAPASAAAATPVLNPDPANDGIAATVNDTAISDYELDQRIAMQIAVSGFKPDADDMKRIRKEALERLEEEKIQLADARKHRITVSPVEVNRRIEGFAKEHNVTVEQLGTVLEKAGTSLEVLRAYLTAASAWQKTLLAEFQDAVVVTPAMIAEERRRAAEGANKTHYHVSEIFLQVDSPDKDAEVKKQLEDIENKIRKEGASFRELAQQFSRNPSAAMGGEIGWVYDGQLDPALNSELAKMKPNELSHPVRGKGGWYLLGLQERQEPLGTDVSAPPPPPSGPPGTLKLARLLLPLPAGTSQDQITNTLKAAATQIRPAIASCDVMEKLSKEKVLEHSVFQNLGQVQLSGLSEEMQKALAPTKPGDVAEPFLSPAGVEIIARCDERPPPPRQVFKIPSEDDIHEELFQEQISALAKRYMRDLKRDANIQERDQANSAVLDAALIP